MNEKYHISMTGLKESKLSLYSSMWIPLVSSPMPSALYLIYLHI